LEIYIYTYTLTIRHIEESQTLQSLLYIVFVVINRNYNVLYLLFDYVEQYKVYLKTIFRDISVEIKEITLYLKYCPESKKQKGITSDKRNRIRLFLQYREQDIICIRYENK
jgi:hypothetical protein